MPRLGESRNDSRPPRLPKDQEEHQQSLFDELKRGFSFEKFCALDKKYRVELLWFFGGSIIFENGMYLATLELTARGKIMFHRETGNGFRSNIFETTEEATYEPH